MASPNYGSDLACTTDLDPTLRLVSGAEMMGQVCLRRLYCRRGGLISAPNARTLDARDFLNDGIRPGGLTRIAGQCQAAILDDPRVFDCVVAAEYTTDRRLLLTVRGTGSQGPFALTLSVNELTIDLLRSV